MTRRVCLEEQWTGSVSSKAFGERRVSKATVRSPDANTTAPGTLPIVRYQRTKKLKHKIYYRLTISIIVRTASLTENLTSNPMNGIP